MTTFGELKIVASQDIGELGAKESEPVVYNWKWYYSAPAVFLWVVLLLVLVLVKANHNRRALLIFVPLVIANLVWFVLKKLLVPSSSSASAYFDLLFNSLTVGLALLLLLSHKLGNRNRLVTFILALVIMFVSGLIEVLSFYMGFSPLSTQILIFIGMLCFAFLTGLVIAGWWCKKRYTGLRFMLWLALGTISANLVVMLGYFTITMVFVFGHIGRGIPVMMLRVCITSLVIGGILYLITLPYVILVLRCSFFRERFYACLRLQSMANTTEQKKMERNIKT